MLTLSLSKLIAVFEAAGFEFQLGSSDVAELRLVSTSAPDSWQIVETESGLYGIRRRGSLPREYATLDDLVADVAKEAGYQRGEG